MHWSGEAVDIDKYTYCIFPPRNNEIDRWSFHLSEPVFCRTSRKLTGAKAAADVARRAAMANFMIVVVVLEWNMTRGLKSGGGSGSGRGIGRSAGSSREGPRTWRFARNVTGRCRNADSQNQRWITKEEQARRRQALPPNWPSSPSVLEGTFASDIS